MLKNSNKVLHFYQGDKLITMKQGSKTRTVLHGAHQPLAELQGIAQMETSTLLQTDAHGSVLGEYSRERVDTRVYSAYGHEPTHIATHALHGFNAEMKDFLTGNYLLGSGYRVYGPTTFRFNSPDSWSPFSNGGINSYAYCASDPVNRKDPTGHMNIPGAPRKIPRARLKLKITPTSSPEVSDNRPISSRMLNAKKPDGTYVQLEVVELFEGNPANGRKVHVLESQRAEYLEKYELFQSLNMKLLFPKNERPENHYTSAARDRLLKETRRITSLGEQAWGRAETTGAGSAVQLSTGIRSA